MDASLLLFSKMNHQFSHKCVISFLCTILLLFSPGCIDESANNDQLEGILFQGVLPGAPLISEIVNLVDGVEVRWSTVSLAEHYLLFVAEGSEGLFSRLEMQIRDDHVEVEGLAAGTYRFYLVAVNEFGQRGPRSDIVEHTIAG